MKKRGGRERGKIRRVPYPTGNAAGRQGTRQGGRGRGRYAAKLSKNNIEVR